MRRFIRFSLRSLLILILVASVCQAWMANRAAKQRRAVALVAELDGGVFFQCESDDSDVTHWCAICQDLIAANPVQHPPDGFWHDLLGHEVILEDVCVTLMVPRLTDQQLGVIVDGLPSMDSLCLGSAHISDAGLAHLSSLDRLEDLTCVCLDSARITDAGLEHLVSLDRLETVWLLGTSVTANGTSRFRQRRPDVRIDVEP